MAKGFVVAWTLVVAYAGVARGATAVPADAPPRDPAYEQVIAERAGKIVAGMGLPEDQARRTATLIADQYRSLSAIHARLDEAARDGDAQPQADQRRAIDVELFQLHRAFVARLAAELTPEQVDQVRDGMTYGVVPVTYARYLALLPELTDDDRRQIKAWLVEAREYAMDGGSSEEKHGWFRKYKGRINNYLSQRGLDLNAAEARAKAEHDRQATN